MGTGNCDKTTCLKLFMTQYVTVLEITVLLKRDARERATFIPRTGFMQHIFEHQYLIPFEKAEKFTGIIKNSKKLAITLTHMHD